MQTTGERIKKIRQKTGFSMEKFGGLFEPAASKGVVSNWENNYNLPNNKRLKRIAEIGNTSVDYILNGTEEIELPSFNDFNNLKNTIDSIIKTRDLSFEDIAKYSNISKQRLQELYSNEYMQPDNKEVENISVLVGSATGQIICYFRLCENYGLEPNIQFNDHDIIDGEVHNGLLGRLQNDYIDLTLLRNTVYLSDLFDENKRVILDNQHLTESERQKVINCLNEILDSRK